MKIIPGILEKKYIDIQSKTAFVKEYVPLVQLDICDGTFTETYTWPYSGDQTYQYQKILNQEDGLPFWQEVDFELDLMVQNAHKKFFTDWVHLGPKRIIFHFDAEDTESLLVFFTALDPFYTDNIEFGIAAGVDTNLNDISPFVPYITFIQCMGISHVGLQGSQFDQRACMQMKKARELFPGLQLTVDGGVNSASLRVIKEYNPDRVVVGSAIFKAFDIKETIDHFEDILS